MGRTGVRLPVVQPVFVLLSSTTSGVDTLLDFLPQEMIAQHHFTGGHPSDGFYALTDVLPNTGGKFGWTEWAGQVKMDPHLAPFNLYLIEQTHFTQRTANFWVADRASRRAHGLDINSHRDGVPATPVSVAGCAFTYSRFRWAISSFSISLS